MRLLPRDRGVFRRESPTPGPFRAPAWRCRSRWPAGAAAARVHRGWIASRLDPCSHAVRVRLQGRVRFARLLQVVVSASTTTDHSNIPNDRIRRWDDCLHRSKVAFRAGQPPALFRDRGREHRASALPTGIAPGRDFAPSPIAPGTLLSRGPFFSLSGATWEKGGTAGATHACTAYAATGSCGVPPPRRGETLTNPRGLLSSASSLLANGRGSLPSRSWTEATEAPFPPSTGPGEGRSHGTGWLGLVTWKSGKPPTCHSAAAPLTTSAFEWRSAARVIYGIME
jgi:hypothetical protein